jgi:ABC-type multidrug transport system ATPase subunit
MGGGKVQKIYLPGMIELKDVVKAYGSRPWRRNGGVRALDGVTLSVRPGTALGVIGLNGAGKSTLLRVLLGYVRPTEGSVTVGGTSPRAYAEAHGIAYVPERVTVPKRWTVRGALRAYAMLGDLGNDAWERVDAAIERLGLGSLQDRPSGVLSKGNLQRLALAQAILGDRKLMVLDEPTDGLDPVWIAELRAIITDWRAADPNRTVILASHNLPEVERLADHVVVLHNGRIDTFLDSADGGRGLEERFIARLRDLEEPRP